MKLIPNWHKKIHRLWTARLAIIGSLVGFAADVLPQLQDYLPQKWYLGLFILILIARFVAQPDAHE